MMWFLALIFKTLTLLYAYTPSNYTDIDILDHT